jgi:lipoyl-dependent peroxiredoxin
MAAERTATVTWTGDLAGGSGSVSAGTSQLFTDLPVSWSARTEAPAGQTSPEEPPEHLHVSATVTFDKVGDAWTVVSSQLDVVGVVPGLSEADFDSAAQNAKENCPVSRALAGNVELSVDATLEMDG